MEDVITTRNLTKRFGAFLAVNKMSTNIKRGEIYGFLGPNGAGKTTAIRMLCGILEPTAGDATVLGYDLRRDTEKIKSNIGYMSQKFSLYDDLTVEENLVFYAGVYNVSGLERRARIREMIDMARLNGRERELAGHLSGGWKQRLALGCAIIARPSLVFLDEPTSGVSPTSRRMFFDIIQKLVQEGTTVVVTTHFMDEAERCHKIAFISEGNLLAVATPAELKKSVIQGHMVELALPRAIDRLKEFEKLPYVKDCSIHGPLLHVLLKGQEYEEELSQVAGVKPNPITPSLEDVFVTLAKGRRAGEVHA